MYSDFLLAELYDGSYARGQSMLSESINWECSKTRWLGPPAGKFNVKCMKVIEIGPSLLSPFCLHFALHYSMTLRREGIMFYKSTANNNWSF